LIKKLAPPNFPPPPGKMGPCAIQLMVKSVEEMNGMVLRTNESGGGDAAGIGFPRGVEGRVGSEAVLPEKTSHPSNP